MVVPQQAAESLTTLDLAEGTPYFLTRHDDAIGQSLVIAFFVVMGEELANRGPQRRLAEKNHPIETLFFERAVKSFQVGVQIWTSRRQED